MSFKALLATAQRLTASMETLAAILAELKLRQSGEPGDPQVRACLQALIDKVEPGLLDGMTKDQEALVLAANTAYFKQAMDLIANPASGPGWQYRDADILQAYGVLSKSVVRTIDTLATQCPDFDKALREPGTFVDLGTGVAGLAIEAARTWPALKIIGLDMWEPALALAEKNIAKAQQTDRIELRKQCLEAMDDQDAFTVVWFASPFFPKVIVPDALQRIKRSLKPGGWVVFGLFSLPADPLDYAVANLKTIRRGGHPWIVEEVEESLRQANFQRIQAFTPPNQMWFVIAQK